VFATFWTVSTEHLAELHVASCEHRGIKWLGSHFRAHPVSLSDHRHSPHILAMSHGLAFSKTASISTFAMSCSSEADTDLAASRSLAACLALYT